MRIAILSTIGGYAWGGTEEVWFHFAKQALADGHEVMVAADYRVIDSEPCRFLQERGLLTSSRRTFRPARLRNIKSKILPDHRELLSYQPDVLLINAGSPYDLSYQSHLGSLVERCSCKKVFFCHFNSDRMKVENRERSRLLFGEMDHVVFVNGENHRQLEMQLARNIPTYTVVLNSSRLTLDHPLPFPQGGTVRFANVARLETAWKGQDILAEIFGETPWRGRDCVLECYGTGPEESLIQEQISLRNASDKMRLAGYVRDIQSVWAEHYILLLPSRGEGTPLAALEAMMCGRPVIATDVGGNAEIIEDGVTGFLAEAPTWRSFGAAMERAWKVRDRWEEMGRAAHARANELAASDPAGKLLEILITLVAK